MQAAEAHRLVFWSDAVGKPKTATTSAPIKAPIPNSLTRLTEAGT